MTEMKPQAPRCDYQRRLRHLLYPGIRTEAQLQMTLLGGLDCSSRENSNCSYNSNEIQRLYIRKQCARCQEQDNLSRFKC